MSRRFTLLLGCDFGNYAGCSSLGNSQGPPWIHNDRIIPEEGCSCHGAGGSPSNEVIFSHISGVPRVYEVGGTYNFTISLAHTTQFRRIHDLGLRRR